MSVKNHPKTKLLMLVFLSSMVLPAAGKTIYVDCNAPGPVYDGIGWSTAFKYLQDGLSAVTSGDEIHVAQGIYRPDENNANPDGTGSLAATFQLKNGVAVRGGYAGYGEPNPDARDVEAYETILSGDLAGNDREVPDPCELPSDPCRADNCYHVTTGSGTDTTAILDGFTITGGGAKGDYDDCGGGMYNYTGSPTVSNCTFSSNSAEWGGAGMYNEENSSPIVMNCTFNGNSAWVGGGMEDSMSSPTIIDCIFSNNWAVGGGGIKTFGGRCNEKITRCTFINNVTSSSGGGMYNDGNNPVLTDCNFIGNTALGASGGGLSNHGSDITLINCTFTDNSAKWGGGIYNHYRSSPTLINCTFNSNTAATNGGGIWTRDGFPVLENCTFINNTADANGGGMHNVMNSQSTLTNCAFIGNTAGNQGGGFYSNYCTLKFTNCIFSGNTADYGGGIHTRKIGLSMTNCTLTENSAYSFGGGIYSVEHYVEIETITNCILWGNSAPSGLQIYEDNVLPISVSYSDVEGGWPGTGNIDADPLFASPATDDYHLLYGSPCINAGNNSAIPPGVVTDFDGDPRIIGGIVDMGAYEGPHQGLLLSAVSVRVPEGGTATFTVRPAMNPHGTVEVTVAVDSGDSDITVQSGGLLTFNSSNYSQPQTVTLAAAEDADAVHGCAEISLSAAGGYSANVTACEVDNEATKIIYVDGDARGTYNGSSWKNAFYNPQNALAVAQYGDEIRVAEGVYTPICSIPPPPPPPPPPMGVSEDMVTIKDADDRELTFQLINGVVIKGGYAGFGEPNPDARDIRVYETILSGDLSRNDGPNFANNGDNSFHVVTGSGTDSSAVLDGFTITAGNANGSAPDDCGSGMINNSSSSPTVTNCTFKSNSANWGGGMYNYDNSSPTVTGCTFSDNVATTGGGGMINNSNSSPTVANCLFSNNSADWGGGMYNYDSSSPTAVNCTFRGNAATDGGGAMINSSSSSPTVTNCILWGNSAPSGPEIYNDVTSSATTSYCDVQGGWLGTGNIDADPCFMDAGGGDFRLSSNSLCIDAGDDGATNLPDFDMDGHSRIIDGDCDDSAVVDMGAYEFNYAYMGDLDYSCSVDFFDFSIFGRAWETKEGDPDWDWACDISDPPDDYIDWRDMAVLCDNWLAQIP